MKADDDRPNARPRLFAISEHLKVAHKIGRESERAARYRLDGLRSEPRLQAAFGVVRLTYVGHPGLKTSDDFIARIRVKNVFCVMKFRAIREIHRVNSEGKTSKIYIR